MFKKKITSVVMAVIIVLAIVPMNVLAAGNTWQTATLLTESQSTNFTISASNEEIWYKVSIPSADQTIKISASKVAGGQFDNSIHVALFEESTLMAGKTSYLTNWNGSFSTARDMNWKFTNAGTYYIRVAGQINLSALQIQYSLITPDAYENNDTWQNATPVAANTPIAFTISATNDEDWYKITVPLADQTIKLSASKVAGGQFDNSIHVALFEESALMAGKTSYLTNWNGSFSTARDMNWKLSSAGTYYIRVAGQINLSALQIQYSLIAPDAHGDNDTWQNATFMEINTPIQFTIAATNEEDWYKITVPSADQTIKISASKVAGGQFDNSIHVALFEESTLMAGKTSYLTNWNGSFNTARDMNWKFTNAGTYYIRVAGQINLSALQIQYSLITPDAYENNDTWQNATPVVANEPMAFTISATNDEDWYKITVPSANQTIKLSASKVAGGQFDNSIHVALFEESTLMAGKTSYLTNWNGSFSVERTIEYNLTNAGTYYIRIAGNINLTPLTIQCNFGYPGAVIKGEPTQPNTSDYLYNMTDPGSSVVLPIDKLPGITDKDTAIAAIQSAASGLTAEQKQSATGIDLVTLYAEEAVAQAASKAVSGGNIVIDQSSIQSLQASANDVKAAAEQTLASSGVAVQRELNADVKFKTNGSASVTITIDTSAVNTTADNVRVETPDYAVTFSADSIKQNAGDTPLVITITEGGSVTASTRAFPTTAGASALVASTDSRFAYTFLASGGTGSNTTLLAAANTKTYTISFNKPVDENIKISLPPASGDPTYQAVINSQGSAVGGKYNPVTNTLDVKISASDTYTVRENRRDFSDISSKSKEMQDAIIILASKGIISGTSATTFSPDDPITRAEIAALIVRTLSKYDANADGGFEDVSRSDWYFGSAGSAKKHGIMSGTSATTFAPTVNIPKDQIVCVAARVLRIEMKYKDPTDVNAVLSVYKDASSLAGWSLTDLAMATRENLVIKRGDGMFNPNTAMTRGDAAIILYRMFMKIW